MGNNIYLESQSGAVAMPGSTDICDTGYGESVDIIRTELKNIKESFVRIGWHLKKIKDNSWYQKEGYKNIYEFAKEKFNISQPTATRFINICTEFSESGSSPELAARYQGYSLSQLTEMLNVGADKRQGISPDMTVRDIRGFKRKDREIQKSGTEETSGKRTQDGDHATSHVNSISKVYIPAVLQELKSDAERREWLENVKDWGLWYIDQNIHAAYYKYDFPDGSKLIAVEYGYGEKLCSDSRKYSYHIVYSDSFRKKHIEQGNSLSFPGYFTEQTVEASTLIEFLRELQEEGSADAGMVEESSGYTSNEYIIMEFDPDHLEKEDNKNKSYVTRQYIEFYNKNHYIPKYFNAKDKKEITDYVRALTTSSGSDAGIGSIIIFDAWKEIEKIDEKLLKGDITWEDAERRVCKIWQIAKPEEQEKIKKNYRQGMLCKMEHGDVHCAV